MNKLKFYIKNIKKIIKKKDQNQIKILELKNFNFFLIL